MKLIKLEVQGYKNLKDIKIDFTKSGHCSLIIGTNGSGKSNLLEVFSAIFYALYNGDTNVKNDFSFTLEYVIERMRTGSAGGGPLYEFPVWVKLQNSNGIVGMEIHDANNTDWGFVDKKNYDMFLPEHVVAIYSGEEKRLWENFYFDFYDNYNKQYKDGRNSYKTQKMIYMNYYYWDIVASVLSIYDDETVKKYLEDSGLKIAKIKCEFDINKIKENKNAMAKEILEYINPESKKEIELKIGQIAHLKEFCGYEQDVFYNLLVLVLYKQFKIITNYKIVCENGMTIKELSEGEKKLLLIYGAIRIIEGETLFLLDEPDAHLHEGIKKEIYDLIKNNEYENQFIITSHSPTMTSLFDVSELFILNKKDDHVALVENDKKYAISLVTNGEWSYIEQTIFFDNKKPLVIVEGKSDIDLIKQAVKEFSKQSGNEKYSKIDYEFLAAGGTGNIPDFYKKVREIDPDKKIIILCDNDKSGIGAIKQMDNSANTTISNNGFKIIANTVLAKLPKLSNIKSEFVIEDYFSKDFLDSIVGKYLTDQQYKSYSSFPRVKDALKEEISKNAKTYLYENLKNMKILLDLLYDIGEAIDYI